MTFWTSKASRKFSMGLKYMLWVCKAFSRIREIERTSNHVRTTRREKTAYPIPKTCGKRTSEPPIQSYFSSFFSNGDVQNVMGWWTKEVESFNGYRLTYLPKLKDFPVQHLARMLSALADWNEAHGCPEFQQWRKKILVKYGLLHPTESV